MVYVAPDGTVYETRPWTISKVTDYFWGIITFVVGFFRTLIPGGNSAGGNDFSNRGRGGSGGPGGPGGGGPRRRMGGITTIQDCSMPGGG